MVTADYDSGKLFRTRSFGGREFRTSPLEVALELENLNFPRPGAYEIFVHANYLNLHMLDRQGLIAFPPVRVTVLSADGSPGGVL